MIVRLYQYHLMETNVYMYEFVILLIMIFLIYIYSSFFLEGKSNYFLYKKKKVIRILEIIIIQCLYKNKYIN